MPSPCDPQHAPAGDVGTALMIIDSQLRAVHDGKSEADPQHQLLVDQFTASMDPEGADDVLDGTCSIIYMFMQWLQAAYDDHGKNALEYVVPDLVAALRMMPLSVRPETVPTMAGLLIAAGTGLSPSLWRKQYGYWTEEEMKPLEATAFLLAEHINRLTEDRDFATRMIGNALSSAEGR
ncbi:hypothetical protein SAMN05216223_13329 [Actinacidiphila yanglinensis]|uniref:Uncharacterized protein n=1 Tax=Actinacidiphila yanglinensis TaxID=310779 RepID=A0A1H6EEF3_9ACTN|nr:hypothetical protein [Actinacidiphila yanglinensis]SEG95336.1 hypothetical protein SAMN05216223_13329 [Actinacidiphila yanglinensis]